MSGIILRFRGNDERGAALLAVIGVVAAVTALVLTVATLSVNNLRSSTRDKQALSAMATSEAGVAEAIEWLRSGATGLSSLTCMEPAPGATPSGACLTNPAGWTSSTSPKEVAVDGGACTPSKTCYKVWIGTLTPYKPPLQTFGVYRVHSTGYFGDGPSARRVAVDVKVKPYPYPIGVYAQTLSGGGNAGLHRESLFTQSCVTQRAADGSSGGLTFAGGVDLQYDLPPAAHSTDHITTDTNCKTTDAVHKASAPCNTALPDYYDQSGDGGDLSGTVCKDKWTSPTGSGKTYPTTSKFTLQDLQSFGYRPRGLSDAIYSALKSRAQAAGTYFTDKNANPYAALNALGGAQSVLYYEIPAGSKVTLGPTSFPNYYLRQENDGPSCPASNLTIVVQGGDLTLNSVGAGNSSPVTGLVSAIFVPDGSYDGQGSVWVIGSIFALNMKLAGTQDFRLDKCYVENPPSAVLDVQVTNFREDDSKDIN